MLTIDIMHRRWPHGDQHVPGLAEGIVAAAPAVFASYGIDGDLVLAHLMAQFSEECGCGLEMVENLNYSAEGLIRQWPKHFTGSMPWRYAHNPRMIADVAYGGRMGNAAPPSDDGWKNRGRGLSQTTGAEAYAELAKLTGLDLMANPDLINVPEHALLCGVVDFVVICKCLEPAKADNLLLVTERLNGGTSGLAERRHQLGLWKHDLGVN